MWALRSGRAEKWINFYHVLISFIRIDSTFFGRVLACGNHLVIHSFTNLMARFHNVQSSGEMCWVRNTRDILRIETLFDSFTEILVRSARGKVTERFVCLVCLHRQLFSSSFWEVKCCQQLSLFLVSLHQDLVIWLILVWHYLHPWTLIIACELVRRRCVIPLCLLGHLCQTCRAFTSNSRFPAIFLL